MARGVTLATLVSMVKAETGDYAGTNTVRDAAIKVLLSNKQKWLATEFDWPFLERRWNVPQNANAQFGTFPGTDDNGDVSAINLERFPIVEVQWNTKWQPVEYGIGMDEYNTMDIAFGQQSDPIQRWRAATNPDEPTNPNQFEVWPVPVTNQVIRFTGQRTLLTLAADNDTADLDDMLLVYFVAAEILTRGKQADAKLKTDMATRRLQWVRQNYPVREKIRVLGNESESQFKRERRLVGITIAVR